MTPPSFMPGDAPEGDSKLDVQLQQLSGFRGLWRAEAFRRFDGGEPVTDVKVYAQGPAEALAKLAGAMADRRGRGQRDIIPPELSDKQLVEELRAGSRSLFTGDQLTQEAAARIERLRGQLDELQGAGLRMLLGDSELLRLSFAQLRSLARHDLPSTDGWRELLAPNGAVPCPALRHENGEPIRLQVRRRGNGGTRPTGGS